MPITVNGCGTKYYGKRELMPDGSYTTTEWIVLVYIPLIPIGSFQVLPISKSFLGISNEYLVKRVPFNLKQIRNTYIAVVGIFGVIITGITLSQSTDSKSTLPDVSPELSKPYKN